MFPDSHILPSMSLSLLFPSVSLAYSPPIAPDLGNCDELYAEPSPATFADCQQAFQLIPSGPREIPWFVNPESQIPKDPYDLPFNATYGAWILNRCPFSRYIRIPASCTGPKNLVG